MRARVHRSRRCAQPGAIPGRPRIQAFQRLFAVQCSVPAQLVGVGGAARLPPMLVLLHKRLARLCWEHPGASAWYLTACADAYLATCGMPDD